MGFKFCFSNKNNMWFIFFNTFLKFKSLISNRVNVCIYTLKTTLINYIYSFTFGDIYIEATFTSTILCPRGMYFLF